MAYQIPNFDVPDDALLAERIAMKRAHVAHYEQILARSVGNRWYDQGRRNLAQLRQELDDLMAQVEDPGSVSTPSRSPETKP